MLALLLNLVPYSKRQMLNAILSLSFYLRRRGIFKGLFTPHCNDYLNKINEQRNI